MIANKPLRRLVVTADVEKYSSRTRHGQEAVQRGLMSVLESSDRHATLRRLEWERQPQGDAEVALLPPGIVEGEAISDFMSGLATALHHHNRSLNSEYRLRLRVAIDQGNISIGEAGFVGNAVISACRMRDSDLLRRLLTDHPNADFVIAVSDAIYTDVVDHRDHEFYRWRFTPHEIRVKEFSARVWVCVPEPSSDTGEQSGTPESTAPSGRPSGERTVFESIDLRGSKGANVGDFQGPIEQHFH
ncbi:hypothetical protein [Nocardiopsis lambiniae]|uniref:Uncharacterized protein n=1 Tax=Nocardiopsis lambiniae TaxID=3075539 RepID=A0ABU2MG94_9ACTN|nr:hypothetical protein [Nocardiopsis sp. DSM 44743]MDT0331727.1 hypothetical protein [Nocardiopsis sp. DSM 44743]